MLADSEILNASILIVDDLVPDAVLAPIADSGVRIIRAG